MSQTDNEKKPADNNTCDPKPATDDKSNVDKGKLKESINDKKKIIDNNQTVKK